MTDPALAKASGFLARFLGIVVVLFLLWSFLSPLYLSSLVLAYNAVAPSTAQFAVHGESLAVVYHEVHTNPVILQLGRNDVFYMNLLIAPALLLATPLDSGRPRWAWIVGVGAAVWIGHFASLGIGRYLVIWDFVDSLDPAQAQALAAKVEAAFPRSREELARAVFDRWRLWGRPTMALVVWFYVASDYLGFGSAGSARGRTKP